MRFLALLAVLVPVLFACAPAPRSVSGKAEAGTTSVFAIDSVGRTFRIAPAADRTFNLALPTKRAVHIFVQKGTQVQVVKFAATLNGAKTASTIPNHDGTVHMGALSTASPTDAESADDPLDQVDQDGDGQSDAADNDDDNDGQNDDVDTDDDGDCGNDDQSDLDTDNDGEPDEVDSDADGNGVDDVNEPDAHNNDGDHDGVPDASDADVNNDGQDEHQDDGGGDCQGGDQGGAEG